MKNTIPLTPVKSSQIHSIGFDPDTSTLAMRFLRREKIDGEWKAIPAPKVYQYSGITPEHYQALAGAESIGTHFGATIKSAKNEDGTLKYPFVVADAVDEEKPE